MSELILATLAKTPLVIGSLRLFMRLNSTAGSFSKSRSGRSSLPQRTKKPGWTVAKEVRQWMAIEETTASRINRSEQHCSLPYYCRQPPFSYRKSLVPMRISEVLM
jgi:hypothetical protein